MDDSSDGAARREQQAEQAVGREGVQQPRQRLVLVAGGGAEPLRGARLVAVPDLLEQLDLRLRRRHVAPEERWALWWAWGRRVRS